MGLPCGSAKAKDGVDRRKDIPIEEHEQTLEQVFGKHQVTQARGLTSQQVADNRAKHGWNRLTPPVITPAWLLYLYQYTNFFAILLIVGGILCFIAYGLDQSDASNLYLGVVLEAVVFISSTFSYYQEAKSNALMQGFKNMVPKKAKVVRDGATAIIDAAELVPGDVVQFQDGDQVPADLRVVDAYNLKVDNSSLTGESEAQDRTVELLIPHGHKEGAKVPAIEASNLMFFSTIIVSGHGTGVVVGTGDNTVMGQIAGLTAESGGESTPPLIREINAFIKWVSIVAILLGLTFLGVGLGLGIQTVVQSLVYCISVIVATVPEGLLCTLTVALALTAKRMHNVSMLVKNLQGVETLGCTTVIASDKTGTLTQNRMTVQHCWYDDELRDIPAPKNSVQYRSMMADREERGFHGWRKFEPESATFTWLHKVATVCNNSEFMLSTNSLDPAAPLLDLAVEMEREDFNLLNLQCTGDASESGLIKMCQAVADVKRYREKFPKLFEIKFNSTNKWQLSIHKDLTSANPDVPMLVLKGAPEKVWALCDKIMVNGKAVPITQEWRDKFQAAYEKLGSLGERVLGFAYRDMDGYALDYAWSEKPERNFPTDGLTFCGLLSLMDPPRDGVPDAVARCKRGSIRVYMVTGDHPITAKAIANEIGILDEEVHKAGRGTVCTGDDIRNIMELPTEEEQIAAWDKVLAHEQIVFARVTPAHKLMIVENCQRHGHIVTVTGDGVNDAPALKKANNGVSMGIAGKDVSKEAADMILMDDNFASIVNGVEEGRLIFDNLKKSIMYTLTSKPPELIPFILWVAADFPLAISTILILAIDLGTDMLPAIALAYETKESQIMLRPPRDANKDFLVDVPLLIITYLHFGVLQALAAFWAFVIALNDFGYPPHTLLRRGLGWSLHPLVCSQDGDGTVDDCGFGCAKPRGDVPYCEDGCFIPTGTNTTGGNAWRVDPFIEFTPEGFRGFGAGSDAVCARTCSWFWGLSDTTKATWRAARNDTASPLRLIFTEQDEALFNQFCGDSASTNAAAASFGFPARRAASGARAPVGGRYYWDLAFHNTPDLRYQQYALQSAQTAYFVTAVWCKIMNVLVTKTRKLSIFQHGIRNNRFLLVAVVFECCLVVLLVYVPFLNVVFNTQPLYGAHWVLGIPWILFLFCYDELRKLLIRRYPGTLLEKVLYY
mmetsp:Transcript_18105/g.45586  ORF Transcript_18105/g.45586 Transcript_18105/m.45586 type:complete len:1179 (-) Transcript_18105:1049-4585(-)